MTCFKKCPVTGEIPTYDPTEKQGLYFEDPIGQNWNLKLPGLGEGQAAEWWNNTYVPFWEKWVESQKPVATEDVQFEVGDVVGPSLDWVLWGMGRERIPNGFTTATVLDVCEEGGVTLDHSFWEGAGAEGVHPENLRLVSRVQKLTVEDLPKIDGVEWSIIELHEEHRTCLNDEYFNDGWCGTEHEAVQTTLQHPLLKTIQQLLEEVDSLKMEGGFSDVVPKNR